ncbi:MAG: divergent polysaccharide deacetylase family protein [Thermoanaerobaculia bacterium]
MRAVPSKSLSGEPDRTVEFRNQAVEGAGAMIALVIDDLGRSLADLDRLSKLQIPLSYAVLPFESQTSAVVEELTRRQAEILCHLPMEPGTGADPGRGALTLDMSRAEMRRAVQMALWAVPGARGVNNHMGSRMTEDPKATEVILEVLSREGLFYLDSRTSAKSQGYRIARRLGVPVAQRQVFLDDDLNPGSIRRQFAHLKELARKNGRAIAIGHPHRETLAVLESEVRAALRSGYQFVPVSRLLDGAAG